MLVVVCLMRMLVVVCLPPAVLVREVRLSHPESTKPPGSAPWPRPGRCVPVRPVAGCAARGHPGAHAGGPGDMAQRHAG